MLRNRYMADGVNLRLRSSPSDQQASVSASANRNSSLLASVGMPTQQTGTSIQANNNIAPVSNMAIGGLGFNTMFTGIAPPHEESLIPYYRDIYYYDSVGGATVDINSNFPYSDYTLVALQGKEMEAYEETMSRLNVRSLMSTIVSTYLTDGAFIGSLVLDTQNKVFQDILLHDRLNCSVTLNPFASQDPVITANASGSLSQFLASNSPYTQTILNTYPQAFVRAFSQGAVVLDPVTTVFLGRRGQADLSTTSFLKRLLPFYFLEKTLYRGTLIEATKRQRATTHIMAGTDTWEPTVPEMQAILSSFQTTEHDPLGAWLITRNGVQVQDIRQGGDFWKVTDVLDQMVPHKLRALGMSEAFLAGDTSLSASEVAYSVFLENSAAFRSFTDHKIFKSRIFPLVAVLNNFYKDSSQAHKGSSTEALVRNLSNHRNLRMPELHWHKRLDNHDPTMMDTLEKLGEKGIPVPLKLWSTAAGYDMDMLLGDLSRDQEIRDRIEELTGKRPDDSVNEDSAGGLEYAKVKAHLESAPMQSFNKGLPNRPIGLINRDFNVPGIDKPVAAAFGKSGKTLHSVVRESRAINRQNELFVQAAKNLSDPNYRKKVKDQIVAKFGYFPKLI